jgi:hypothetical protein
MRKQALKHTFCVSFFVKLHFQTKTIPQLQPLQKKPDRMRCQTPRLTTSSDQASPLKQKTPSQNPFQCSKTTDSRGGKPTRPAKQS